MNVEHIIRELYPFRQIQARSFAVKVFCFLVWTIQVAAMFVIVISLDWTWIGFSFGVLFLLEVIVNGKILHIKRPFGS